MDAQIRVPRVEDADALGRVHGRAWQAAYAGGLTPDEYLDSLSETDRASMWRSSLEDPPQARRTRLVATVDDEVVGFALVGPAGESQNDGVGELYAINVDPDHWGTGTGVALIDAAVDALQASRVCLGGSLGAPGQPTSALVLRQAGVDRRRRRPPARSARCRGP